MNFWSGLIFGWFGGFCWAIILLHWLEKKK